LHHQRFISLFIWCISLYVFITIKQPSQ
jgi:hypothetical protein